MLRKILFSVFAILVLSGCQQFGIDRIGYIGKNSQGSLSGKAASAGLYKEGLPGTASWGVLPFINNSEATGVTIQVERILMVQLPSKGVTQARLYPESEVTTASKRLADAHRLQNGKQWARLNEVSFSISGEIDQWFYNDAGKPVVTLSVAVTDVRNGEVIWSTRGTGEGKQGDDLFDACRTLLADLLDSLPVNGQI
ncbi:hypothetical protein EOPP23_10030 [Endozoicomonas sp. OPT23]|uniref:hypothetical protein n=1 Tax=Endozoicomonas sp. OPT23 TaxID=2072845 RepID=UPI00129A39C2|nr:hypothetical protein [Endozoicomonas sp. OPT23]MRI33321.1 hypothetical protein [Endozoicomonas sp. OPT23]